jgi:hypothetical protein
MAGTISNTITSSYTLTVTPTTITDTGAVAVTSGAAIYGPGANPWTVLNFGSIDAGTISTGGHGPNGFGVDLIDGGAVTNASGGTIAGRVGVGMAGANATISNAGSATIAGGCRSSGWVSASCARIGIRIRKTCIRSGSRLARWRMGYRGAICGSAPSTRCFCAASWSRSGR